MSRAILPLEPIAVFAHNYHSRSPLCSWPPVPADDLHQGEMLAIRTFGSLLDDIRSPRHIYFASWRDPDPNAFPLPEQEKPPTAILFNAQFGVAPYETPSSLIEMAKMFEELDRAQLRLDLLRDEEGVFYLEGIELELNNPASSKGGTFRSCWKGDEIKTLNLTLQFDAPATRLHPFRFHLHARLPRRYNRGETIEKEQVEFTASGGAMPLPRWVNY